MTELTGILGDPITNREALMAEWERCSDWIEEALAHDGGHYSLDDVLTEILAGRAMLWPGERAAMVTQFWFFPKLKAINIWLAGGEDAQEWKGLLAVIEAWAMLQGCGQSLLFGRRGVARWIKSQGYHELFTGYAKTLTPPIIGRC